MNHDESRIAELFAPSICYADLSSAIPKEHKIPQNKGDTVLSFLHYRGLFSKSALSLDK
jgi:hypothetical protein